MQYAEEKCIICSKKFYPHTARQLCCSKECTKQNARNRSRERQHELAVSRGKAKKETHNMTLGEIAKECSKRKISYGRYSELERQGKL